MTPTPPPHTPIAAFWADLGIQQGWMNEPVLMSDDPIWKMTAPDWMPSQPLPMPVDLTCGCYCGCQVELSRLTCGFCAIGAHG